MSLDLLSNQCSSRVLTSLVCCESTIEERRAEIHVAILVCQRVPIVPWHLWFILYLVLYLVFTFHCAKAKPRWAGALALPDSALCHLLVMFSWRWLRMWILAKICSTGNFKLDSPPLFRGRHVEWRMCSHFMNLLSNFAEICSNSARWQQTELNDSDQCPFCSHFLCWRNITGEVWKSLRNYYALEPCAAERWPFALHVLVSSVIFFLTWLEGCHR